MALISCPECGHRVSSAAAGCPSCGFPVAQAVLRDKAASPGQSERAAESDQWNAEVDPKAREHELRQSRLPVDADPPATKDRRRSIIASALLVVGALVALYGIVVLVKGRYHEGDNAAQPVKGWTRAGKGLSATPIAAPSAKSGSDQPSDRYTREEYRGIREATELFLDTMAPDLRGLSGSEFRIAGTAGGWNCSDRSAADMQAHCKFVTPHAVFWLEGWYRPGTRRVAAVQMTVNHPAGEALEDVLRERYGASRPAKGAGIWVWKLNSNTAVSYHRYRDLHYLTYGHPKSPHVVGTP